MSFAIEQNSIDFKAVDDVVIFWIDDRTIPGNLHDALVKSVGRVLYTVHSNDFDIYMDYIMNQLPPDTVVSLLVHTRFIDRLLVTSQPHVHAIYGLGNKFFFRWKNTKVRDVFYDLNPDIIVNVLKEDFDSHFNRLWSIGISIFQRNTEAQRGIGELSRQNAQFMWYQLLVKILTQMPSSAKSKDDMLQQSFLNYKEDKTIKDFTTYEKDMHELKRLYTPEEALKWYTRDSFVYRLLNQACRTSNIDLMFSFRFLIRDIFLQITKLYTEQKDYFIPIIVYRGTTVSQEELDMLQRNVGSLVSRHQFLSTSIDKNVASVYANDASTSPNETLFLLEEIYIDPDKCNTTPFASVRHCSSMTSEQELLLSIGSVFRIKSAPIQQDGNSWTIQLELVDNDEKITEELHHYLELNIENEPSPLTLSHFLLWMGKYDRARHYCEIFLTQLAEYDSDRPVIYNQIGYICQKMGKFDEALQYLNQSIAIFENLSDKQWISNLSGAYNDRGLIHKCRGEYTDALINMHKALEMRLDKENQTKKEREVLAVQRSHVYENLGILYKDNTEYNLAIHNLQEALNLREKYLPNNHYWIAQTYNNLTLVHTTMCNYKMALECIKQAIEIQRQSLPENHPHLATMYQTQANLHYQQGEYVEALNNFQHAYKMYRSMPYCDPLMVAAATSNIGSVYNAMGNYTEALPMFTEAFNTQQKFAPRHPNMIKTLNNMAMVCSNMGDIDAFMNYSQEALRMCREILGEHHENTAITYFMHASKLNVDQYDLAMDYFNCMLTTYIQFLHLPHHNNVIACYTRIGIMERKRGQFDKAHQNFRQAVDTFHCSSLSTRHSLLTKIYVEMALTYREQGQIDAALHAYEQAIEHMPADSHEMPKIRQSIESLRSDHMNNNGRKSLRDRIDINYSRNYTI